MKPLPLAVLGVSVLLVWWGLTRHWDGKSRTLLEANKHKVLLICQGAEPRSLDPHLAWSADEARIIGALLEGLVAFDCCDQAKIIPGMADHWDHNDDDSIWTFHIRENARWSNGDPVTAEDFVFSYKRALTAGLGCPYSDSLFILKGAEQYFRGELTDFSQVGVKPLDSQTLQFELVGPTPYLLAALTLECWFPVHPATVLKFGRIEERDTKWTLPGNYVGNGPFLMTTWKTQDVIETVRNPAYWDVDNVHLNGINFYLIEDEGTQERAFRAGQLHMTRDVQPDRIAYYKGEHPDLLRIDPVEGTQMLTMNVHQPPLNDARVRLALSLAIDRGAIVHSVTREGEKPATGYTPPGIGEYKPLDLVRSDPERARQVLAEAGYPDGARFPHVKLWTANREVPRAIAEAIQDMWKRELHIDVQLESEESRIFQDAVSKGHFQIVIYRWGGDFMDPITFLSMWTTGNPNNGAQWSDQEYDNLIQLSNSTADKTARLEVLHRAEERFLNQLPVIPIYWNTQCYLLDPSVRGWSPMALALHNYKFVDLQQATRSQP